MRPLDLMLLGLCCVSDGFRLAGIEITGREPTGIDAGPSRPEGSSVRSPPLWAQDASLVPQQTSAHEAIQWNREATRRDDDLHQRLATAGPLPSQESAPVKSPSLDDFVTNPERPAVSIDHAFAQAGVQLTTDLRGR